MGIFGATLIFLFVAGYPRQWTLGLLINDEFWYAHLARSVYDGLGYVANAMYPMQAPHFDAFPVAEGMKQSGYPLLSALVWQITGVSVRAMLSIAAVGLAAFAGLIYLLARQLAWGRGTALFVAGATVLTPYVAQYGVQALPESLYFACFTLVVLLVLQERPRAMVWAAIAHAVLIVIKGHGIIYLPVFLAYFWMRGATTLRDALFPSMAKLRIVGTYFGVVLLTLVIAAIALPDGSVQIFEAGGTYSYGLLIETGRGSSTLPYLETQPTNAWEYIFDHPGQYFDKVARQVRRTKIMVNDLGGPAFDGILFPALLLSSFLLVASIAAPKGWSPLPGDRRESEPYLLFVAIIGITLLFFWPIYIRTRFLTHALPLMLLICLFVAARLVSLPEGVGPRLRKSVVVGAIAYFVAYPAAVTIWQAHRHPFAYIGNLLAVRFVDYDAVTTNIETLLPEDPVVVSDMAHEITWLTGARTILFPLHETDLEYLVRRYDVDALYEHPVEARDWQWMRDEFTLVDDANGLFWVRRRDRE